MNTWDPDTQPRMWRRRAAILSAGLLLSGCGGEGISLSPDETRLAPCPESSPRPTSGSDEVDLLPVVEVDDLVTRSPVSCDLAGWALQFPDGQKIEIGDPGSHRDRATTGGRPRWRAVVNLGVYGVVASMKDGTAPQRSWGTPQGLEMIRDTDLFAPPAR